jgi:hypothetical protein
VSGPKETVYDEQISPLVKQINALCKEHGISVMSTFILDVNDDEDSDNFGHAMTCLSYLPVDGDNEEELAKMARAKAELRPRAVAWTEVTHNGITTITRV